MPLAISVTMELVAMAHAPQRLELDVVDAIVGDLDGISDIAADGLPTSPTPSAFSIRPRARVAKCSITFSL